MKIARQLFPAFSVVLLLLANVSPASGRTSRDFDAGWRFSKGDFAAAMMPAFDDGGWQAVTLPHDWSSDGPFSAEFGSGNGYAPGGIGWYRKHFQLDTPPTSASVTLEFDGVYDDSEVWVNGQFVGGRPYGFSSFQCDLTPFVKFGSRDNVVAVRVDHSRFADSRYYTGSGIYRNVRLVVADSLHVAHWGVAITTPSVKADSASVHVATTVENSSGKNEAFALETDLVAPDGSIVATGSTTAEISGSGAPVLHSSTAEGGAGTAPARLDAVQASAGAESTSKTELRRAGSETGVPLSRAGSETGVPMNRAGSETGAPLSRAVPEAGVPMLITQELVVRNPRRWSLEDPELYRAVSRLKSGGSVLDEATNTFGIREFQFDADRGFFLNGRNLKIKGVCLHHDAGPIGAAVPDQVLERRLRTLKEIGVNAIRTSHNPPDPALLDYCDRLGFLVMDEAFDEFTPGKNKWVTGRNDGVPSHFGYNEIFAQWSVADVQDMVRRDRNHPGIILWSIGNEIDYANDPFSHPVLGSEYRPGNPRAERLVACAQPLIAAVKALDRTRPVTAALATVAMSDAVGLAELLDADGYNYQESRYADDHRKYPRRILYGSENSHQYSAWLAVRTNDFIAGQFLWTGADYLGEANAWPNRASGAGLLDLCGFKKPLGWFRQSLWSDQPMVYLCVATRGGGRRGFGAVESWNWPANATVTVQCYANCPEVTLTLNGKVIGVKKTSEAERGVLRWEMPYEPGTLQAIGRAEGREVCRYTLQTAGAPARIQLRAEVAQLHADGKDICHLAFQIVDAAGVRVPDAAPETTFELTGPGKILGIGNGDVNSVEDCKANTHRAYQGRGLVILQTTGAPGEISVKATSPGLQPAGITLPSR